VKFDSFQQSDFGIRLKISIQPLHQQSRAFPKSSVFTARCTLVQSAVLRSHVVCLSVCLSVTLRYC